MDRIWVPGICSIKEVIDMKCLSVIVPIYNEENNIYDLYLNITDAMKDRIESFEMVMVNDGSRDGSTRLLNEIAQCDPKVKIVHLERHYGLTAAIWAGIRHSEGKLIALVDGGLQTDPRDIFRLMPFINKIDFVNGRWTDSKEPWVNKLAYRSGILVRNWMSGDNLQDPTCPLKLFKREVAENLYFFEGMHRFLPTLARMHGYSVIEVSVTHRKRRQGGPRQRIIAELCGGFMDAIVVGRLRKRVVRYREKEGLVQT